MIQEISTYIIVGGAFIYVGVKVMEMFRKKPSVCKEESPSCRGCQLKESCQMTNSRYR